MKALNFFHIQNVYIKEIKQIDHEHFFHLKIETKLNHCIHRGDSGGGGTLRIHRLP